MFKIGMGGDPLLKCRDLREKERSNWRAVAMVAYSLSYLVRSGYGVVLSSDIDKIVFDVIESLVTVPLIDRSLLSNLFVS